MMIAEVLFVGRWQTARSFSLSQRAHAEVRMRWRIFNDESHYTIDLCERFLRRRVSGYLDPLLAGRFIPAFFEKICLDHYRRDLSSLAGMRLELPWSFNVFQIDGCS
jgi:hypothetical protein